MKFDELSEKAKERARNLYREEALSSDWWFDCAVEDFVDKMKSQYSITIDSRTVYFNVGYSQNDYVSFSIYDVPEQLVKPYLKEIADLASEEDRDLVYDAIQGVANDYCKLEIHSHGTSSYDIDWHEISDIIESLSDKMAISDETYFNIYRKYEEIVERMGEDLCDQFAEEARELYRNLCAELDGLYDPALIDDAIELMDLDYDEDGTLEASKHYLLKRYN